MAAADGKERVTAFFEALSAGDLDRVATFFDDDSEWVLPCVRDDLPGAGTHRGVKGIIDGFLAPVRGMFTPGDPKLTLKNLVAEGPYVVVEADGHGSFANGTPYENHYCFVIELDGDTIRTLREYMDSYYVSTVTPESAPA